MEREEENDRQRTKSRKEREFVHEREETLSVLSLSKRESALEDSGIRLPYSLGFQKY